MSRQIHHPVQFTTKEGHPVRTEKKKQDIWPPVLACMQRKKKSTLSSIHQSLEESAETESVARSHILLMSFFL